ncbi:MAG: hypothetical protein HUK16_09455 [Bacteroidales bacterium]|nr:hypothetical protein [Bacteroidales bacterium]
MNTLPHDELDLFGKDKKKTNTTQGFSVDIVRCEMENAGKPIPEDLQEVLFDYSMDYPEPEPIYQQDGKPIFTRGGLSCISGKAKSCKSFLVALFAGEILRSGGVVLLIDTEQGEQYVVKSARRVLKLAGLPDNKLNNNFRMMDLRKFSPEERKSYTERAIKFFQPDIVFIDGIRDLVRSINDEHEATEICTLLLQLTTENNTHICVVLHENKNDNNTRGHIGTEIMNKCETVLSVSKDGERFKVEPKVCRNKEFSSFYFIIDDFQHPAIPKVIQSYELPDNSKVKAEKLRADAEQYKGAFVEDDELNRAELVQYLMKHEKILEAAAAKRITRSIQNGVIIKTDNNHYKLDPKYQDNGSEKDDENLYF